LRRASHAASSGDVELGGDVARSARGDHARIGASAEDEPSASTRIDLPAPVSP